MKRLFAAIRIHPSEKFLEIYNDLVLSLKHEKITWVQPFNFHLTLKFFGETPEDRIPEISRALGAVASECSPFNMNLANSGIFGSRYAPRVIWFGIAPNPALSGLADAVRNALLPLGYVPDRQNFVPHLTAGRIKEIREMKYFQKIIGRYKETFIQEEEVDEIILFESTLTSAGPVYTVVETYRLGRTR